MKEYLKNKTPGFFLAVAAGIFSIIGLIFYLGVEDQGSAVIPVVAASIILLVAVNGINAACKIAGILGFLSSANALLLSAAVILSIIPQVDNLGYFVSGLYSFADVKAFILYAVFAILAWLGYLASSFMEQQK